MVGLILCVHWCRGIFNQSRGFWCFSLWGVCSFHSSVSVILLGEEGSSVEASSRSCLCASVCFKGRGCVLWSLITVVPRSPGVDRQILVLGLCIQWGKISCLPSAYSISKAVSMFVNSILIVLRGNIQALSFPIISPAVGVGWLVVFVFGKVC